MIRIRPFRLAMAVMVAACIAAACSDGAGPPEDRVVTIEILSGNNQNAAVATVLPLPITIRALDAQGLSVAGAAVTWELAPANGMLSNSSTETDSDGRASTEWLLGTTAAELSGTVTIGTVTASFNARATPGPTAVITLSPNPVVLDAIGAKANVQVNARDAHDNAITGRAITWASTNAGIVIVDDGEVTAVATGSAKVRATIEGVTGEADVNVAPVPTTIVLNPTSAQLTAVGQTVQFQAVSRDRNNNVINLPAQSYTWTSTDGNVVSVDANGLATAEGGGSAIVRATIGSVSGEASVTVTQLAASLAVSPQNDTLTTVQPTLQLTVVAKDENGATIPAPTLTWSSADETIATVAPNGLVTAVANGVTRIHVVSGAARDSATITVRLDASPAGKPDSLVTKMNTALVLAAPGLLANDNRGVPDATIVGFGGGSLGGNPADNAPGATVNVGVDGSLRVNGDGSITFTPTTGFTGTFTFRYRLQNPLGMSDVEVVIEIGNAPVPTDDAYATTEDVDLLIVTPGLLGNDDRGHPIGKIVSFGGGDVPGTVTDNPVGQLIQFGSAATGVFALVVFDHGGFTFDPPPGFTGTVTFMYRVANAIGTSDATVTITVGPTPQPAPDPTPPRPSPR